MDPDRGHRADEFVLVLSEPGPHPLVSTTRGATAPRGIAGTLRRLRATSPFTASARPLGGRLLPPFTPMLQTRPWLSADGHTSSALRRGCAKFSRPQRARRSVQNAGSAPQIWGGHRAEPGHQNPRPGRGGRPSQARHRGAPRCDCRARRVARRPHRWRHRVSGCHIPQAAPTQLPSWSGRIQGGLVLPW